ncbi:MAG: hypothetical protein WAV21_00510 [Minisyncoccia bacterium]
MSYFSKLFLSAAIVFLISGFGTSVFAALGDSCDLGSNTCGAGFTCSVIIQGEQGECVATTPQNNGSNGGSQNNGQNSGGGLQNPLAGQNINSVSDLLTAVLTAVVQIGFVVVTLMLVWVGFLFVTAQGNSEKISTARTALLWTVIGGLILLGSTAIAEVIGSTASTL